MRYLRHYLGALGRGRARADLGACGGDFRRAVAHTRAATGAPRLRAPAARRAFLARGTGLAQVATTEDVLVPRRSRSAPRGASRRTSEHAALSDPERLARILNHHPACRSCSRKAHPRMSGQSRNPPYHPLARQRVQAADRVSRGLRPGGGALSRARGRRVAQHPTPADEPAGRAA
jgi:hypothetical protein